MVEAPGTAPGSDGFITLPVYRHSRVAPAEEYRGSRRRVKSGSAAGFACHSSSLINNAKTFPIGMLRCSKRRVY